MSRRERQRRPARRASFKEPRKQILVVTEGVVTEREYINGFARHHRHPLVRVVVAAEHGDPSFVVRTAKEAKHSADAEADAARDENLRYDEVWCVFDRDEHARFSEAIDQAHANGLQVAASNPCFELWVLLHFKESPGPQDRRVLQRMLRDHLPKYDKHIPIEELLPLYAAALARASRLEKRALEDGEPTRNPTTGVHRLTESIRAL